MKAFETPINEIESIYAYFHEPAHSAEIQMDSAKTKYVWQHISNYYPTEQILRDGPIHELPEQLDPAIGIISVKFSDGTAKTVAEYFETSTMDAMLVNPHRRPKHGLDREDGDQAVCVPEGD